MITRDLAAAESVPTAPAQGPAQGPAQDPPEGPSLGSAIDPAVLASMRRTPTSRPVSPASGGPIPSVPNVRFSARKIGLIVGIAVVVMVLPCVLGVLGFVVTMVTGSKDSASTAPTSIPSRPPQAQAAPLHTAAGWEALVAAIKAESGTSEVYDVVAYRDYAVVGMVGKGGADRRLFRDGAFVDSFETTTDAMGEPVDLAQIEPGLIERLVTETVSDLTGSAETGSLPAGGKSPEAYLIISAAFSEPRIAVYVTAGGQSQYRVYGLDGSTRRV